MEIFSQYLKSNKKSIINEATINDLNEWLSGSEIQGMDGTESDKNVTSIGILTLVLFNVESYYKDLYIQREKERQESDVFGKHGALQSKDQGTRRAITNILPTKSGSGITGKQREKESESATEQTKFYSSKQQKEDKLESEQLPKDKEKSKISQTSKDIAGASFEYSKDGDIPKSVFNFFKPLDPNEVIKRLQTYYKKAHDEFIKYCKNKGYNFIRLDDIDELETVWGSDKTVAYVYMIKNISESDMKNLAYKFFQISYLWGNIPPKNINEDVADENTNISLNLYRSNPNNLKTFSFIREYPEVFSNIPQESANTKKTTSEEKFEDETTPGLSYDKVSKNWLVDDGNKIIKFKNKEDAIKEHDKIIKKR